MNKRIFVEKKSNFNIKAQALVKELKHNLQLTSLTDLRIIQVYDVFNLAAGRCESSLLPFLLHYI